MSTAIITPDDLYEFKMELIDEIKKLLQSHNNQSVKRWLKSQEVRELLGISPGTLQNLRINGTIPFTKIGGVLYYDYNEIIRVLEENRVENRF